MKSTLSSFFALAFSFVLPGATLWVDKSCGKEGASGSETDPFRTIQQAVDAAAEGTVIKVRPGIYDEGERVMKDQQNQAYSTKNRVFVGKKKLVIESTDGYQVTTILGQHDPSGMYGMGENAVRCILVANGMSLTVRGFTLANGATQYVLNDAGTGSRDTPANRGGAIACDGQASDSAFILSNCLLTNNVGTRGGAVFGGRVTHSTFIDNHASNYGHAARESVIDNSLFIKHAPPEGMTGNLNGIGVIAYGWGTYNSTIADNYSAAFAQTTHRIANSIVVGNNALRNGGQDLCFTNCIVDSDDVCAVSPTCRKGDMKVFHSPATQDYRLDAQAVAIGAANPEYKSFFSNACKGFDLLGNPFPEDGTLSCGAIQETVKTAARIVFTATSSASCSIHVNGIKLGLKTGVFAGTEKLPASVRVKYENKSSGLGVLTYQRGATGTVYPQWDGTADVKFEAGSDIEIFPNVVKRFWVNPQGDDTTADGTREKPYKSIQAAIDGTVDEAHRVICAEPGVYEIGETENYGCKNRVSIPSYRGRVFLTSVGGRDVTTILGKAHGGSADGRGADAVRCLFLSGNQQVSGFTLKNGYSGVSDGDKDCDQVRGGAAYVYNDGTALSRITDCIITECCASRGTVAWSGRIERCIITGNTFANNGLTRGSVVVSCLIYNNRIKNSYSLGSDTQAYQCTVADEIGNGSAGLVSHANKNVGLILGAVTGGCSLPGNKYTGSFAESMYLTKYNSTYGNIDTLVQGDAYFSDDGLYRPCGASAAVNLLSADNMLSLSDVYGNLYAFDGNGKTVAGAVAAIMPGAVSSCSKEGGVSPLGLLVPVDGKVTVTANFADKRGLTGFFVNGVLHEANADNALELTVDGNTSYRIDAVYSTNYFVSVSGSDLNVGDSWDRPLKTLAEAACRSESGDVVKVAPGVYATGDCLPTKEVLSYTLAPAVPARVFVKSGVTFESCDENGRLDADNTVIEGQKDFVASDIGLGGNAMHCVLMAPNATLRGFTLRGGGTGNENVECINNDGGGVWARDNTARIEWCTFTNNAAYRGAGARHGTYVGCRFIENRSVALAPASRDGYYYGCFFDHNVGETTAYGYVFENCTFGANNSSEYAIHCVTNAAHTDLVVANTVVAKGNIDATFVSNVVIQSGYRCGAYYLKGSCNIIIAGNLALDARGMPQKGSPAIDAGDVSIASSLIVDLNRGQRIYNNALDCGAFEYDWRGDYARSLSPSPSYAVLSAPAACEKSGDGVLLLDGEILSRWEDLGGRAKFSARVRVTGGGTLYVFCDDEEIAAVTSGNDAVTLSYLAGAHNLKFAYARAQGDADGLGALISSVAHNAGTLLFVR